jgi:uncharacterized protein (DUF1786 family)
MPRVKVVMEIEDVTTGREDVLVKTGEFENSADGMLNAFVQGMYDKYLLVLKAGKYVMRHEYWKSVGPGKANGLIKKLDKRGEVVSSLKVNACFKIV